MKPPFESHDLALPAWGPYTKKYSGISHIPAAKDGVRFDLSVFPGLYRRRVDVPNVTFESGYHVWKAAPDLSCYTMRHELEWKDQVYADISFAPLGEDARLIRAELCNRTGTFQDLVLHYMASAWDPQPARPRFDIRGADIRLPEGAVYLAANDYDNLEFAVSRPLDHLGFDGLRRAEEAVEGFTGGYGVGDGFGGSGGRGSFGRVIPSGKGDRVQYTFSLPGDMTTPCLGVRYCNPGQQAASFALSCGGTLTLSPTATPVMAWVPLPGPLPKGQFTLTLTGAGSGNPKLDCLVLCDECRRKDVSVTLRDSGARPEIFRHEEEGFLVLRYPHIRECYGVLWLYRPAEVREIENDELDIFLRYTVQDHVSSTLRGNGRGHFTNVFQRPIPLKPGQTRVLYGAVCCAPTPEAAAARCRQLLAGADGFEAAWAQASRALCPPPALPAGQDLQLGQQLMQAVLCTNVVYPVYTRRQYIRHNTPGRWWDSLYTWDSGFIGIGLAQFSVQRALDCLNAYLTPDGDEEAAFIFHGSMVPTQFYLFAELLNKTGSRQLAADCYPKLRQYYRFISGRADGSTTANLRSGLLRPWDYFYNSGGWDDYPPQQEVRRRRLQANCTPVVTTAHAARCARILAYTAELLGLPEEAKIWCQDVENFKAALQKYAWDADAGYFGYVLHDEDGNPCGILRDDNGVNFNAGLGGASPLFADLCTPEQQELLWVRLQDPHRLWSDCGLSTVDRQAPYYRKDGYWNGSVWMPYQWIFFKSALDAGMADFAFRIAQTALELWQKECAESYHCFEHFNIETRRGAGWHQFSGLSSPVVHWFAAYYRPGTLTVGFDTFVAEARWEPGHTGLWATLDCTRAGRFTVLAALAPGNVRLVSRECVSCRQRHSGLWELTFAVSRPGRIRFTLLP